MPKFKDSVGDEWDLRLTCGDVRPLREVGLDLNVAVKDVKGLEPFDDLETRMQVFWTLLSDQAKERGLTPEQFARRFDGPTMFAACECFEVAFLDFSLRPTAATAARKKLTDDRTRAEAKFCQLMADGSKNESGNSPASSESIPAG